MQSRQLLLTGVILSFITCIAAGESPPQLLSDFQDPAQLKRWTSGDSGLIETTIEPRAITDSNMLLKVLFKGGAYPGISMRDVPRDWTPYEVIRFVVWCDSPMKLLIRIDDGKSTDHASRFGKVLSLDRGRNLCQIKVSEIDRVLKADDIRQFILFMSKPPSGVKLWFDD